MSELVTMPDLLDAASRLFKVNSAAIVGASQRRVFVDMRRHIVLAGKRLGFSSVEIGRALNRDHSSILNAMRGDDTNGVSAILAEAAEEIAKRRVRDFLAEIGKDRL